MHFWIFRAKGMHLLAANDVPPVEITALPKSLMDLRGHFEMRKRWGREEKGGERKEQNWQDGRKQPWLRPCANYSSACLCVCDVFCVILLYQPRYNQPVRIVLILCMMLYENAETSSKKTCIFVLLRVYGGLRFFCALLKRSQWTVQGWSVYFTLDSLPSC